MYSRRLIDKHFEPGFFGLYKLIHFVYLLYTLSIKKRLDFMACFVVNYNNIKYNNPVAQLVEHLAFNQ